jgi:glycosyltransferase involved in cell wall biosynthesis
LQIIVAIYLCLVAAVWTVQSLRTAIGISGLPHVGRFAPLAKERCPRISIIFAARDESENIRGALTTLVALDYPNYEIIAVDDRSTDATAQILEEFASRDAKLRVIHIDSLPAGWLGKPHALEAGHQAATGEWFVFTDADVHFAADVLSRVMTIAIQEKLDHLSLFAKVEMVGFWERVVMTYFGLGFAIGQEIWRANNPKSSSYVGIGAFQLIRREAYEAFGGHRPLAMEVVDDMKLAKLVKRGGFRTQVAIAPDHVWVRWHAGVKNLVHGTTKNFFAVMGFRFWYTCLQLFGLLAMSVVPWVAFLWLASMPIHGATRLHLIALMAAAVAVGIPLVMHAAAALYNKCSPLYGLTHPFGALIMAWMVARSTIVTLWQGGIVWRETFYPLEELKRGLV